ncbi:phosphatase PAP2 family protein [Streptomyces sp. SID13031]|uniref:phosphatase PAP2 family protein n=1 Tax=Streptomyces sp. SID13031 TaxID=2706046 RepID=UPI0013C645A6|nr:phosphatase PAP2 family protein [Streptomyces sp. SID13031]NEA33415.1 inositol phosphorylceramide synthase [Streptomyces sp. SID13031]
MAHTTLCRPLAVPLEGLPPLSPPSEHHTRFKRIAREIALLAVLFGIYNLGRLFSAHHAGSAFVHADTVRHVQDWLGLPTEAQVQHLALQVPDLARAANRYYASVHFPLTAIVLVWLLIRRPVEYAKFRWALASLTGLALIGHLVFPLAPPRMFPQYGLVDTAQLLGQSVYNADAESGLANQFAAMPSLHVGWAFLVAVFLIRTTKSRWRWLWIAHPVITFAVVVVTANHYWLDGLIAIGLAIPLVLIFDSRRVRRDSTPAGATQLTATQLAAAQVSAGGGAVVASSSSARTR